MEYFEGQTVPAHIRLTIMIHCLATSRAWGEGKNAAANGQNCAWLAHKRAGMGRDWIRGDH